MDRTSNSQVERDNISLSAEEASKKIKELIENIQTCFFCTTAPVGEASGARPMSVQKIDDYGNLWFLSARDSNQNKEIALNPKVHLYFQSSAQSDFLHLYGTARISDDKTRIAELWQPSLKAWFKDGEHDSNISVIKVTPSEGFYWDTKHGNAFAGKRMLIDTRSGFNL